MSESVVRGYHAIFNDVVRVTENLFNESLVEDTCQLIS